MSRSRFGKRHAVAVAQVIGETERDELRDSGKESVGPIDEIWLEVFHFTLKAFSFFKCFVISNTLSM